MSKNGKRGYVILAILFVIFTLIAFAAPFTMNMVFWLAYAFGVIAIAFQIYVFNVSFSGGKSVKSKFYGFPIAQVGIVYLIVQLMISLAEMGLSSFIPGWCTLIINAVLLAIVVIGCIAADVMRDEIVRQDEKQTKNVSNIRSLQSTSAALPGQCDNAEVKKLLEKLAEDFKYSDPVSSDGTVEIERELETQLKEIQKALIDNDSDSVKSLCMKCSATLKERNRVCALNK